MKNITWALAITAIAFLASCQNRTVEPAAQQPAPPAEKGAKVEIHTTVEPPRPHGTEVHVGNSGVDVRVQDKRGNGVDIHKDK